MSEITGSISVCPDVEGISYSVEGPTDNSYDWTVVGGTLVSGQGTSEIIINWGAANPTASVKVTPFNYLGCRGDDVLLDVTISKRLEPAKPQSDSPTPEEVCFSNRNRIRYFTPQTNGSEYEWFIDGGIFTTDSNPSSNEVFVDWRINDNGRVWYREFNRLFQIVKGFLTHSM